METNIKNPVTPADPGENDGILTALMLGGNLGDTLETFRFARKRLAELGFRELAVSRPLRSAPVDCIPGTPDFLDQALTGRWKGSPEALLKVLQQIEREAGRPAKHSSAEARVLDCDVILMGDLVRTASALTIPHPRAQKREFVLRPLAEIAPGLRFPDTGRSVEEALHALAKPQKKEYIMPEP